MSDREVLEMFLSCSLDSPKEVFDKFLTLKNARLYGENDCVYVPGSRSDRVLLVAHADTVFAEHYGEHKFTLDRDGIYHSWEDMAGIGADDRAGCAILWLLKDSGHSLLITNNEEIGSIGVRNIKAHNRDLYNEFNEHQYILEFDRRNARDYKVYDISVTNEFKRFIEKETGFTEADRASSTDITVLCDKICGANLSVGYYYEHRIRECLVYKEWENTLNIARKMLEPTQKKFRVRQVDANLDRRTQLKNVFYDTAAFCCEEPILSNAIRFGLEHTEVYKEKDYPELPVISDKAGIISVTKERTFEAAIRLHKEVPGKKIAVLNFAAATTPGGGTKNGAKAQEECLCRCSTLMQLLEQEKTMREFYIPNQKAKNPLHNDSCIYSQGVVICKSDTDIPERLTPEEFVTVDVISCAAPNLGNPHVKIPSSENLSKIHLSRAKHILHIAALYDVDILITGAFGCGAFKNSPLIVSKAWKKALEEYKNKFDNIVFAIYSSGESKNYQVFNATMKNI